MSLRENIKNLNRRLTRYKFNSILLVIIYLFCAALVYDYLGVKFGTWLMDGILPRSGSEGGVGIINGSIYLLGYWLIIQLIFGLGLALGLALWKWGWAVQTIACCIILIVIGFPGVPDALRGYGILSKPYVLKIVGYNYTDRPIAYLSVNGRGGAGVSLSISSSRAGSVGNMLLPHSTKTPFWLDIKYQKDALDSYPPRKIIEPASDYINTKVEVTGPVPANPGYVEIHFYPDGHIEAALSGADGPSPPRLKLERRFPYAR